MNDYTFTILLSASVPGNKRSEKYRETYTRIKNAQTQIEEAVVGLARNVFQAKGKLIFGGHPSISPLITMVATEFKLNREIEDIKRNDRQEKPVTIFQSRAYEEVMPDETKALYNLGYSHIVWTEAIDGEKYDRSITDRPQCEKSLAHMRKAMISNDIDAMVCIGGMEGVEQEFELFRSIHPGKPIFVLSSTGGASRILAHQFANKDFVTIIDGDYNPDKYSEAKERYPEKFDIIPYAYYMARIVKQIQERKG